MRSKFRGPAAALSRTAAPTSAARTKSRSVSRLKRQAKEWRTAKKRGTPQKPPTKVPSNGSSKISLTPPRDLYSELLLTNGLCVRCEAAPAGSAGVCIYCYMMETSDEAS